MTSHDSIAEIPEEYLGTKWDPTQRDQSEYLVHFTHHLDIFQSILTTGNLHAKKPFGLGKDVAEVRDGHISVCFSEIPLDQTRQLIKRHGRFGIGFKKDFLLANGATRVWYLDMGKSPLIELQNKLDQLVKMKNFADLIWKLTPYIDHVIPMKHDWAWEREWRISGGLTFELSDIEFIITPDGKVLKFINDLAIRPPWYSSNMDYYGWDSASQVMGDAIEDLVSRFFSKFSDPIEYLPWDGGDYVWYVPEWSTQDAVGFLFDSLEASIYSDICNYLDDISSRWIKNTDLEEPPEN